jgi:hypothetical protein
MMPAMAPRSGQAMVITALMLGVFFGILGLVVDIGVVIIERRQQQNAVDSAAMGAARLLAGNVTIDTSGVIHYTEMTDAKVMTRAQTLASGNWIAGGVTSRTLALEYLNCSGTLLRAAVAGASTQVPDNTCRVRATGTSNFNTLFMRAARPGQTTSDASARATAAIVGANMTTSVAGPYWPITRQMDNANSGTNCEFATVDQTESLRLCQFWGNNGGTGDTSIGSYKEKIYLSQGSKFACPGPTANNLGLYADSSWIGSPCGSNSVQTADMAHWETYGFNPGNGGMPVGQTIEVDNSGVQGNNDASAMQTFVTNGGATSITHPTWGVYRDVHLIMWRVANGGAQYWNGSGWSTWTTSTQGHNTPDRITVNTIWCFRFYSIQSFANSSEVWGTHISCLGNEPTSDVPSDVANTAKLVE